MFVGTFFRFHALSSFPLLAVYLFSAIQYLEFFISILYFSHRFYFESKIEIHCDIAITAVRMINTKTALRNKNVTQQILFTQKTDQKEL